MGKFYESLAGELSRYVRALAWWHAVPDAPAGRNQPQPRLRSRLSRMKMANEAGHEVDLPHLDPRLLFLVQMLFDAGPVSAGASSAVPLTWVDLDAWQRVTGTAASPGQLRLLRRLSCDYLDEANQASEHDAPPPWKRDPTHRRALVARHIRNVFRG